MKIKNYILTILISSITVIAFAQSILQEPEKYKLKNGMEVMISPFGKLDVTTLVFYINTGKKNETPGQQALASLTLKSLLSGNMIFNLTEQDNALYEIGNGLSSSCNDNFTQIQLEFANADLDRAMVLISAMILQPVFPQEEIRQFTSEMVNYNNPQKMDINQLTEMYGDLNVYGAAHPLGRHFYESQIRKINADKIKEFYKFNYTPANTKLLVCGNPDKDKIKKLITDHFENWSAAYGEVNGSSYDIPPIKSREVFFINKPAATQASLRWYKKAPASSSKELIPFLLANGVFNDVLFDQIRSKEGKTYGIYSAFNEAENNEVFNVSTQVRVDVMHETCTSFDKLLKQFHDKGISADQLKAIKIRVKNELTGMQSPSEFAAFINPWVYRDYNKRKNFLNEIEKIDLSAINKTIAKYFSDDAYKLFISGDGNVLDAQLKTLKEVNYVDLKSIEVDN